jgi:hypothetical protein
MRVCASHADARFAGANRHLVGVGQCAGPLVVHIRGVGRTVFVHFLWKVVCMLNMNVGRQSLRKRYSSLDEYLSHIRARCAGLCIDSVVDVEYAERVAAWAASRRQLLLNTRVTAGRPCFPSSASQFSYVGCVDVQRKSVRFACDCNGMAVPDRERADRSREDAERIAAMTSASSDPFDKAIFVVGMPDMDRVLGEMTMGERREFLWCHLHGLVHLLDQPHRVFVLCAHERSSLQMYVDWPEE